MNIHQRLLILHIILVINGASDVEYEEDFIHSFLSKSNKLTKSERFSKVESTWITTTGYKNVVGISVDNWTNQKLEFPEWTLSEGAKDRWYKPNEVPKHSRDIALLAYGVGGSATKGTISYLVEDSWPRCYISLGWDRASSDGHLQVVLSVANRHNNYDQMLEKEVNSLHMKDLMRFYKGTKHYVVVVTCREEGTGTHLILSVIPQKLDVWAWEKHYKNLQPDLPTATKQKIEVEILPTERIQSRKAQREELENQPGIFERKELLTNGESILSYLGNKTEYQLMAGIGTSVACGVRVENWSQHSLTQPEVRLEYGKQSSKLPVRKVGPGMVEFTVFEQVKSATGVSGVLRWHIGQTNKVLSLMVSVPYSQHWWSMWVATGLTNQNLVPDFNAMYSGTPDSSWFVRMEMGRHMEFSDDDLILVVNSDSGTSKPVVRLSVVPLNPDKVATSIKYRLEGKHFPRAKEGDHSVLALHSRAASQCYCPCMEGDSNSHCVCRLLLILAVLSHIGFNFNQLCR